MGSPEQQRKVEVCVISAEPDANNVKSAPTSCCHVNREMLTFKLHYLLFVSALGVALPYMVVFAKNRVGISTTSIAAMLTVQRFIFILTKPLIGYIADYFNKLKVIIFVLTVMEAVFLFVLLGIPKINTADMSTKIQNASFSESVDACDWNYTCRTLHFTPIQAFKNDTKPPTIVKPSDVCLSKNDAYSLPENSMFFQSVPKSTQNKNSRSNHETQDDLIAPVYYHNYDFYPCEQNLNITCVNLTSTCFLCCQENYHCNVVSCASENASSGETSDTDSVSDIHYYQFWSFAIIYTLAYICINGLFTISDTACCESVHRNGADFGHQRFYGSIAWGVSAALGGFLNDYTNDYLASWIFMIVMTVLALCNIKRMKLISPQFSQNILKDVGTVLASKEYLAFASMVFVCGMGTSITWFYLVWFLTTIGGSRFLCGLTLTVQGCVGEIPFMFFSGWIIKRLGHFNVMTLALTSYCIRIAWYSNLQNPWLVLPVEILHGPCYGLFYPAVATYAKASAKPGTEATTQAVLFTIHEGLGAGLGCILTGIGIDRIGSHRTFFFASIFCGCGAVLSVILHLLIRRQKTKDMTK